MPVPFIMPKFDMDQENATIISWLKHEGERVQADETVLTVETEKIAIDVPAPATGTLAGIRFSDGDVVPVTRVIAYVLKEGESPADLPKADPTVQRRTGPMPAVKATPLAIRMAAQEDVDLSTMGGSGRRISRQDVQRLIDGRKIPAVGVGIAATPAARQLAREMGIELRAVTGTGPQGRVQVADVAASLQARTVAPIQPVAAQVLELTAIRRRMMERLDASSREIPHIVLSREVDVSALEALRGQLNEQVKQEAHTGLSLTALLVKLTAWALERNPYLNASLLNEKIHLWRDVNVGVATAIDDGLVVPVIRNAGRRPVDEIAQELDGLVDRARHGKLRLSDVQGGTFTISNLGMFGVQQFQAIINPPECGILAIGQVTRKPIVVIARDELAIRPMLSMTLSADHRLADGVTAARFLRDLAQAIAAPESIIH